MRRHIYYFLTASFAVHAAGVLLFLTHSTTPDYIVPASSSSAPEFSVSLLPQQSMPKPNHHRQHKPLTVKQAGQNTSVTASPAIRPVSDQTDKMANPASAKHSAQQAELQRREVRDRVLSRLQVNLRRYISYPPLARRHGWQGRVLLGFSIEADGVIRDIHVAAGSGYAILDDSAVAALTELQRLQSTGAWPGQRLELQLPVIYRLQGG